MKIERNEAKTLILGGTKDRPGLTDLVLDLFCNEKSGLVPAQVVGVATAKDTIRLVLEGLRAPHVESDNPESTDSTWRMVLSPDGSNSTGELKEAIMDCIASRTALAIVATTFPQLDALSEEKELEEILTHMLKCFAGLNFVRIDQLDEKSEASGAKNCTYQLVSVKPPASSIQDRDSNEEIDIKEFLWDALLRRFRGDSRSELVERVFSREPGM